MNNMKHLVQEHISTLMPYIPGKPISEVQRELGLEEITKLASNENPCGPSPKAIQAIQKALNDLHLYPDGSGYHLKKALAEKLRVNPDQIILGNGTNEILEIVVRTFLSPGEATISGNPAFIIYSMLTPAAHGKNRPIPLKNYTHDLEAMAAAISSETKIIFIANPNNPTGTMVGHEEFIRFLQKVPRNVIVVADEAYYEYVEDGLFPDLLSYLKENPSQPILITRTFSKAYGLAGLRVGYGIGPSEMIGLMNRVRQPFNVNSLALVAAEAALGDGDHLHRSREVNRLGYQYLCGEFDRLKLTYIPSRANFILVDVGQDAKIFSDRLLREGVIIRPMGGYGLTSSARITIGLPEENQKLIEAMERIL
jgi:histidinol-phosphate aminotransferase